MAKVAAADNTKLARDQSKKLAEELTERQAQLDLIRQPWELQWSEAADLLLPYRSFVPKNPEATRGQPVGKRIYDSTGVDAVQTQADGFMGYLVSPRYDWWRARMKDVKDRELPEVPEWLDECEQVLYGILADSGFYQAMHQAFMDGGAICTADVYIEEDVDEDEILFSPRNMQEIFIADNRFGRADTVCRVFELEAREAVKEYGKQNLDPTIVTDAKDHPFKPYPFMHWIFPREDRVPGVELAVNKAYASISVDLTAKDICRNSGYDINPHAIWRHRKNGNESYGRGPGLDALSDILMLQEMGRSLITGVQKAVDPALLATSSLYGGLRVNPGQITYGRPGDRVSPIQQLLDLRFAEAYQDRLEQSVHRRFHTPFFLILQQNERIKTATEVAELQEEKAAMLGPVVGRLEKELLDHLLQRLFHIAWTSGRLPPAPPALRDRDIVLAIDYIGPLAQAQIRIASVLPNRRAFEQLALLMNFEERAKDWVDFDKIAPDLLRANGLPAKGIRSIRDVQRLRGALLAGMQQAQAQQKAFEIAKVYPNLAKRVEPGSPAAAAAEIRPGEAAA